MPNAVINDRVFIKDLTIEMSAGIYEFEKLTKQRVVINVILDVESNVNKQLSSITDVVSYEDITNEIMELAQAKHYDLLEEFAEKIAAICTQKDLVIKAKITLEKPDIIAQTKSVGIEIMRQN